MKECKICGSIEGIGLSKIIFHHLSYVPEIGIDVCRKCHLGLHLIDIESLEKIIRLKKEYGHLWVNGNEQYFNSNRAKEVRKKYSQSEKGKERAKQRYKNIKNTDEWKKKRQEYIARKKDIIKERKRKQYLKYKETIPEKLKQINREAGKRYRDKKIRERVASL